MPTTDDLSGTTTMATGDRHGPVGRREPGDRPTAGFGGVDGWPEPPVHDLAARWRLLRRPGL